MEAGSQKRAPVYEALEQLKKRRVVPFDVPGHKRGRGNPELVELLGEKCVSLDVNSMKPLDNLCHPVSVIKEAEELAAEAFRADHAFFMVGGTTSSVQGMVLSCCKAGDKIILPRNVHKSVINALVLCGAIPVYVNPEVDNRLGISLGMEVSEVEKAIVANPDAVAVLVNNPTYYGICSDLRSIVKIAHAHNMLVLVDEAHGTHLYFGENLPVCAMDAGADMASVSMHKSGGSLTQSSLLHVGSDRVDLGRLEACLHIVQSTSPSYLLMTSLDAARYELALHGEEMLQRGLALAQMAREAMKKIPGITCVGEASRGKAIYNLDLVRLVISASDLGLSGYQLADRLYEKYKIGMELADDRYVVAVVTYANEESDMRQLVEALEDISRKMTGKNNVDVVNAETRLIPQIPPMIDTPRQAFFKEKKRIPWREAKGKIAAEALIPYPPGIPLVNPGELVTEEIWEYMEEYRKKGLHFHGPSDASLDSFCVL